MENKKKITAIVMTAMLTLALAAFAMPVSVSGDPGAGCPSETKHHGTINGDVYLGYDYNNDPGQGKQPKTEIFTDVPDGIKLAMVYTGFWQGSPGKGENFNITIDNTGGSYTTMDYQFCDPCPGPPCGIYPNIYQNDDTRCDALRCVGVPPGNHNVPPNPDPLPDDIHGYDSGCGVQFVSFNATPYITPGTNTITATPSDPSGNCPYTDGRVYAIALLVVYENASMPEITYWINEGAPYIEIGSDCDGPLDHPTASFYFNGIGMIDNPATVSYDVLGWPHVINASDPGVSSTTLNGCNIGVPDFHTANPPYNKYYDFYLRYDNIYDDCPDCLNPGGTGNLLSYVDNAAFFERAHVAWLVAKGNGTDLIVSDIDFPPAMRPGKAHTINATIKNIGCNATGGFNVSLLVDDVPNGTVSVPGGLGGGNDTTVSFPVTLPYGCYEFKVVADCYDQVNETNEGNNELSRDGQVGYVIVVNGNSDFEELNSSGKYPLPAGCFVNVSGTYYIQNLDIENCGGAGIRIENTDDSFVISNCTVHDCAGEGAVFLGNLVNGTVNDSTIKNNTMKGIRLRNCSCVDIDNNTVQNNSAYGIDVYMDVMPHIDCEFINITRNSLIGNEYGIELIGDNCNVSDNIIRDSNSYGIYVFGNDSKIYNNTINDSLHYGIKMDHNATHPCNGNCIYGNTFTNNNGSVTPQAYDSGDNYWNSTEKIWYYIEGCPCSLYKYIGNNWSDYTGVDANYDKIGDTPYDIADGAAGEKDHYPLMEQWVYYILALTPPSNAAIDTSNWNTSVNITWDGTADAYDIYVSHAPYPAFDDTPTVEDVTDEYWEDYDAGNYTCGWYKVRNANETAGTPIVSYYVEDLPIVPPFRNSVGVKAAYICSGYRDINVVLAHSSHPMPGVLLTGGTYPGNSDKVFAMVGSSAKMAWLRDDGGSGTWMPQPGFPPLHGGTCIDVSLDRTIVPTFMVVTRVIPGPPGGC